MPIWRTIPVTDQPELELVRWRIIELPDQSRHFSGYCTQNAEGRMSSRILEFDPDSLKGVTQSGRIYQLVGDPGFDPDAQYVLSVWCHTFGVSDVKDVTDEALEPPTDPESGGRTRDGGDAP